MNNTTEIMRQKTAEEIAAAYQETKAEVAEAYRMLAHAERRMHEVLGNQSGHYFYTVDHYAASWDVNRPEEKIKAIMYKISAATWSRIIERLGVRQILSSKDCKALDEKLDAKLSYDSNGRLIELDEPNVENIMALFLHYTESAPDKLNELVLEVFDLLTPGNYYRQNLKTNSKFKIGKKVVLVSWCSFFSSRLDHDITTVDRCFHILDGKHMEGYYGPLAEAIQPISGYNKRGGTGETEYFKFKVYHNGNLHLEFKRMDLVAKINQIGGEGSNALGKGNGK